jgi:peptidoglycan/xylan/chitin deacetylase (PgdA/CDA1 family)
VRIWIGLLAVACGAAALIGCQGDQRSAQPEASTSTAVDRVTTTTSGAPSSTTTTVTTTIPTTTSSVPAPTANGPAVAVRSGDGSRPQLALTFDAGSDAGATADILDLLASRGIHASFGFTGRWVESNPEVARRIVAEGHVVFNHTWDHRSFTGFSTGMAPLTRDERLNELRDAATIIRTVTGADPAPWFRPPYGDFDKSVLVDAAAGGYPIVLMWSTDSLGWKGLDPTAVTARVLAGAEPGAIILLHVGSASTDAAALPAILDGLRDRGLSPVTIAELLGGH